jgi:hypothetical protein
MKIFKNILPGMLALLAAGCNDGIDPISRVEPGPDETAPAVTIGYPDKAKIVIPFTQDMTDLDIKLDVTDDIEIKSININLDNKDVVTFNSFLDYRRAVKSYIYNSLPIGHHTLKVTATDLSDKATVKTIDFEVRNVYEAKYDGEVFYMPFEGGVFTDLISKTDATQVGTPGFADGKTGKAYAGGPGEYLTFPTAGLISETFSATLWYKLSATPDRSGILTMGPPDPNLPTTPNNRTKGFRFFREASGSQITQLNVGNGGSDNWYNAGAIPTTASGWVHLAFTISNTECAIYVNGELAKKDAFAGVDWTGCDILSIASGAPRFMEWGHLSDASLYDEIRFFKKALTKDEVKAVMEDK